MLEITFFVDINERIGRRVGELRLENKLTLEEFAARSGVSRAMISKIECLDCNPTIAVLNKLSIGLGMLLSELLDMGRYGEPRLHQHNPVSSRNRQPVWVDPETRYSRRSLTPLTISQSLQLHELTIPTGVRITLENSLGSPAPQQQIWLLEGRITLQLGSAGTYLRAGDCIALRHRGPAILHNPGEETARCLAAVSGAARPGTGRQ